MAIKAPLTTRGLFGMLLGAILILYIGIPYADIVASTLGVLIITGILVLGTLSLLRRKRIVEELQVQISQSDQVFYAGEAKPLTLLISCGTIPFPLRVVITIRFTRGQVQLPPVIVKGRGHGMHYATPEVIFPHRGIWRVVEATAELTDIAGFISSKFPLQALLNSAVTVHPGGHSSPSTPPIISSSYREGDALISTDTVEGEPYNLKRYDPSDGIRKIVWKVFARSGDLISRHIEPSVTPEGQVVVYTIAAEEDDRACKTALEYLLELERLGLEIFFGCEGMEDMSVAKNSLEAQELMMDSVWFTKKSHGAVAREFADFLNRCGKSLPTSNIKSIILFSSEKRFLQKNFMTKELPLIKEMLTARGISPIIHLEREEHLTRSFISKLLFTKDDDAKSIKKDSLAELRSMRLHEELQSWSIIQG